MRVGFFAPRTARTVHIVISDDMRMSPKHFTIRWTQRGGILVDHSDNGTFVQIHQDTPIQSGDIFFAGQTLFQVC